MIPQLYMVDYFGWFVTAAVALMLPVPFLTSGGLSSGALVCPSTTSEPAW